MSRAGDIWECFIKNLYVILLGIVLLIFNILLSKYSFPLTEGWWETYSWLGQNKEIYKEITLPFPPLFIIIQNLILKLSDNFLLLRLIFCIVGFVEFLLIIDLIKKIGYEEYAVVGAFIANALIIIQNPVWIVKDYHIIVTLLEVMFLRYYILISSTDSNSDYLLILKSSLVLACIFLLKQNIAVILTVTIIFIWSLKKIFFKLRNYVDLKILTAVVFWLLLFSSFYDFNWLDSYLGNDSKGGVLRVFLRIFDEKDSRKLILNSILIFIGMEVLIIFSKRAYQTNYFGVKSFLKKNEEIIKYTKDNVRHVAPLGVIVLISYSILGNIKWLFVLTISFMMINAFFGKKSYLYVIRKKTFVYIILIAIIYTGTMTAGFNVVSMQIPIAIFIAFLFETLFRGSKYIKNWIYLSIVLVSCYGFYQYKYINDSYNWWGYAVSPIVDAKYDSDLEKLRGIKFDKNTIEILRETSKVMQDDNSTLLSIPSIPIFYYLYNKLPVISSPVLWFDVFPSKFLNSTLIDLKSNRPDYIFWLKPAEFAYEGHSMMKNSSLPLKEIDRYLDENIKNGNYRISYIKPIVSGNDLSGGVIYRKNLTSKVEAVFNCDFCDKKFMDKLQVNSEVESYKSDLLPGRIKITFMNVYFLSDFIEKYKISPINSEIPIFYIIKKI